MSVAQAFADELQVDRSGDASAAVARLTINTAMPTGTVTPIVNDTAKRSALGIKA
jgi:hypothetical protein